MEQGATDAAPGLRHVAPELHQACGTWPQSCTQACGTWPQSLTAGIFFFPSKQGFQLNDQPM